MNAENMPSRVRLADFEATANYNRGAGTFKTISWYMVKMFFFMTAFPFPSGFKAALLRLFGAKVGKGLVIKPRVNIHMPWKLEIGNDVWIGEEAFLLNFEKLTVGNNVCISQRVFLCGGNHDFRVACMPYRNGPITLEDGSWIGAGSFVSPNVVIGTDTVVTACSTVVGSLPPNGIYSGNPVVFKKARWKDNG